MVTATPWKWSFPNFMKFGTPARIWEKLQNPKYWIFVTSGYWSCEVMKFCNPEAIQNLKMAVTFLFLKIFIWLQRYY